MCGPRQEVLTKLANLQKQQQEQAAKLASSMRNWNDKSRKH